MQSNNMTKELFQEYALLKLQEKGIKARIEELNPKIKSEISLAGADKIDSEWGTFTVMKKKLWVYSDVVKTLEATLEERRIEEQATGSATFKEVPILMFKGKRGEKAQ